MDTKIYKGNLFNLLVAAADGNKDAMKEARAFFADVRDDAYAEMDVETKERLHRAEQRQWRRENKWRVVFELKG